MSNLICAWHTRYFPGEPAVIRAVGENFGGDTHGICPRCYELLFAEAGEMLIPAELETRFVADCTAWQQAGHTRTACHARLAIYQALLKLRGGDWLSRNTDTIKDRLERLEREARGQAGAVVFPPVAHREVPGGQATCPAVPRTRDAAKCGA